MRSSFVISLILTIAFAGLFWFKATAGVCPVPMGYHVGVLDPAFNISAESAKEELAKAEQVWEQAAGRELFYYDESGPLVVDFVFDERQAMADTELTKRQQLDERKKEHDALFEKIKELEEEYEARGETYQKEVAAYESRLSAYNEKVNRYNDQGGAPAEAFDGLEREKASLNRESNQLSQTSDQLNEMAGKINELGDQANKLVEVYNQEVESYNEQFGYEREFTQGDYGGGRINIYKFSSDTELETVLVHEFGHSLGIDHVEGESSVMYYLLGDTSAAPTLSTRDKEAFVAVCGSGDEWSHRLRLLFRSILLPLTT